METSEIPAPLAAQGVPPAHIPTAEENKLVQWAIGRKAFDPRTVRAIEHYIYRKEGSSLDTLSNGELNMLRIEATKLGVSLAR